MRDHFVKHRVGQCIVTCAYYDLGSAAQGPHMIEAGTHSGPHVRFPLATVSTQHDRLPTDQHGAKRDARTTGKAL
jgi:hypothetical protein